MTECEPVAPVLPEDVQAGKTGSAPPGYEEVMGQFMTSVGSSQPEMTALAYIDIMPRLLSPGDIKNKMPPTFQPFSEIMSGANMWLRDNAGLSVWKCETVERKVNEGPAGLTVELESMTHHDSTFGFNCYVFGLRLWLTQKPADQKGGQELGLRNILPTPKEVDVTMHSRYGRRGMITMSQKRTFLTYVGLKKSVEDFNATINSDPIPGSVLNIESTTLKFGESYKLESTSSVAEASSWYEMKGNSSKRYTQILRLFYVKGPSTTPVIQIQEFTPTLLAHPSGARPPKFADFNDVLRQAAAWIQTQSGIKIANIETRDARVNRLFNIELQIDTDTTDDIQVKMFEIHKLKFLRIFYIASPGTPPFSHTSMTSRLFVPVRIGANQFEPMTQTMSRINAWMNVTGLPIFGVETVNYLQTGSAVGLDEHRCDFSLRTFSGKRWLTAIRVYFPSTYTEPPAESLQPLPKGAGKSSSCVIL